MTSLQEPGTLRIVMFKPGNQETEIASDNIASWGPGGSADGTIASGSTPDTWKFLPLSAVRGGPGYGLRFYFTGGATDSLDASDSVCILPVMVNGSLVTVGNSAHSAGLGTTFFSVTKTWADLALVAADERLLYEITAREGTVFQVGGGKTFISVEDDTA